ncbi:hypothetical protein BJF83_23850 [Nocardiopsis sp. CNR-923]|uniref:hypothetical protein n=1 Tax=Nocardiopsis sp. CNR-923 TaxID=1904965 RepID=UPI00096333D5|nr:hypothetical protein [Nocardiopsis sp. CNR-923]OLT24759.1 hypothetical protein BJF83_23850 [Nocardiopsis sp. CNR-923]
MSEAEEHAVLFVRTWAETVLRQIERVDEAREKFHLDSRNYERMEDWSPTEEDVGRAFRALWAEEHTLVWAAHQLEQWRIRLGQLRKRDGVSRDRKLASLRNALEHLVEADFQDGYAVPKEGRGASGSGRGKGRGLASLPDGRLEIAIDGPAVFDMLDTDEVERVALRQVQAIEEELEQDAVERYLSLMEAFPE